MKENMRVLITGATGLIGSHLAEALHEKGYQIRCLVRKSSDRKWLIDLPIEYVEGDYSDPASLASAVRDVDYIYHSAGVTKSKTKEGYFHGNLIPTKSLLQSVLSNNPGLKRFVHISSGAAVGPGKGTDPIREDTPYHPITTYGISKMEAEKECLRLMDRLPITIVRPPAVYGPRDKDVFEFFNTMKKGLQPMIGFSDTYVSLIYVKDLVDGIILAGENSQAVGKTYFISSERFYTWRELGNISAQSMGKKAVRVHIPRFVVYIIAIIAEFFALFSKKAALINIEKAKDMVQTSWIFSTEKAKRELGFKESFSIEAGIRSTIEWYRKNKWL
jgi:dihydroflavonol-4-reductase